MIRPKTYTIKEVLDNTYIGFIFEFYCSKETSFIIEDFKKILTKNIILTNKDELIPSYTTSILLKEYEGSRPRYQFKVDYQNYNEIPTFLNTMLFWINENASLNNSTNLKINLSYNFNYLKTINCISNMDVCKLLLKLNENFIYERFKEMKDNPFVLSIKKLVPYNMNINVSNIVNVRNQFKFPIGDYYGIDLSEQTKGELKFNYIGGPKYSEKVKEIYELLEYFIITTYQCLNENEYSNNEIDELNKLTEEYRIFRKCYFNINKFFESYKDFKILIDLKDNEKLIETQWFQIRDVILNLILENNVKKCLFNWNTDEGLFELKNADIKNGVIKDLYIVDSKLSGIIENCRLWSSKVENSRIKNTILVGGNKINNSILEKTRADRENKINESYIINSGEIINCEVNNSVIKNAGIGNLAKLDEDCLVINFKEKQTPIENIGINIKEPRDYKWIKSLRDQNYKDSGFANEYNESQIS